MSRFHFENIQRVIILRFEKSVAFRIEDFLPIVDITKSVSKEGYFLCIIATMDDETNKNEVCSVKKKIHDYISLQLIFN
jgi:hypothetical protein